MKNFLLISLIVIAFIMIIISFMAAIPAPGLTGLGFIIIAGLFYFRDYK